MLRVFRYLEALDAFVVTDEYRHLAEWLGVSEWNPVVWIGRLFTLDNDYGEHGFDNWEERAALAEAAQQFGIASEELLIIVPERFKNDLDGPCHSPEFRKRFWTDVLQSLMLSDDTLFTLARQYNADARERLPEAYIADLEERIAAIRTGRGTRERPAARAKTAHVQPAYTPRQGLYLAFIHAYSTVHGVAPAETDLQRYFRVSPPSVHQMILTLEKRGLISRIPGRARSIRVLLPPEDLPGLP